MKTLKTIALLAAFVMPLFFAGCNGDDDDNGNGGATGNYFSYDGKNYKLDHGFKFYFGQWWGDGYNWDVYLMSDGIQFNEDEAVFTGTGHGIFFELYSSEEADVAAGTYNYDGDDTGDPYTFAYADFIINFNVDTDTGLEVDITGGSLKVEKSGSNYRFTIDAVAQNGKPVKGFFQGPLTNIDWGDDWKSEGDKSLRGF